MNSVENTVVIINSQEQLDKVWEWGKWDNRYDFKTMRERFQAENLCKSLYNFQYCTRKWYEETNCTILTFREFEEKYLKKEENYEIGEWVIASIDTHKYVGQYDGKDSYGIKLKNWMHVDRIDYDEGSNGGTFRELLRKAEKHEIPKFYRKDKKEDLIEEAKRRYPIGTKFISVEDGDMIRTVSPYGSNKTVEWKVITWRSDSNAIYALNGINTKGGGCSNPIIYWNGNWAKIVDEKEDSYNNLLTEAARRYPLGTKYMALDQDGNTCSPKREIAEKESIRPPRFIGEKEDYRIEVGFGYVYVKGKWAEIIKDEPVKVEKKTEKEGLLEIAIKKYPKGTKFISALSENRDVSKGEFLVNGYGDVVNGRKSSGNFVYSTDKKRVENNAPGRVIIKGKQQSLLVRQKSSEKTRLIVK